MWIRIQLFTLMWIRIQLPKITRIRIRNTELNSNEALGMPFKKVDLRKLGNNGEPEVFLWRDGTPPPARPA